MLRRRRSLSGNVDELNLVGSKKDGEKEKKERIAKLKMSPFPEERGYIIPLKETQRLNQLSQVKMSLSFSGVEKASPSLKDSSFGHLSPLSSDNQSPNEQGSYSSSAAALKPSDVIELQKHVSPMVARQHKHAGICDESDDNPNTTKSEREGEQPSASIKTMWDSVVSWMKTAVDYIAFENPQDAVLTNRVSPLGKKRPLADSDLVFPGLSPAAAKRTRSSSDKVDNASVSGGSRRGSFGRQRKKSGRRMSFGGLRRTAAGATGDGGLGDLLKLEPIKESSHSPPSIKGPAPSLFTTTHPPLSPSFSSSSSSSLQSPDSSLSQAEPLAGRMRDALVTSSPTGTLAGQLGKNLSIKSPPPPLPLSSTSLEPSKLTALPRHMQVRTQTIGAGSKVCKTSSLLTSAMRFRSGNDGLNSILDGSPDPIPGVEGAAVIKKKRIRRQSLRYFYGNSVSSPNLTEVPSSVIKVRRSPRLIEKESHPPSLTSTPVTNGNGIPVPPPPPPIPFSFSKSSLTPLAAHVPPPPTPPPTPRLHSGGFDWTNDSEMSDNLSLSSADLRGPMAVNNSRDMLQKMQSRLRKKMKKKGRVNCGGREGETDGERKDDGKLDIRVRQWAEIQAYSRKLSLTEFLLFAEQRKVELQTAMERLESSVPLGSLADITSVVELLQESSQWFPGGSKEMKDTLPLYKVVEKKIEVLTEFVQLSSEMTRCSLTERTSSNGNHSNLHTTLTLIREEFESKHRHWGNILTSNATSWTDLNLPVCLSLLTRSQLYLCQLVLKFAHLSLSEATKMSGILVSIKCVRTTQVKEKLKECLQLMQTAIPYFPEAPPTLSDCSCHPRPTSPGDVGSPRESHELRDYSRDSLLSSAAEVALSYITVAQDQFEGFVRQACRQEVCEHYEGILKIISLLKQLVSNVPGVGRKVKTSGIIVLLPDAEKLSSAIHSSCVNLIQHIVEQARPFLGGLSPHSKEKKSKEIMLWMMFGCKYVNQTLEALGSDHADEGGILGLLNELQQMEHLLPD